jgi:ribonuclease P/MRP protein subunit RPP40
MLDFQDEMSQREKCYTTLGQLPVFVDPKHLPQKKPPFSTIIGHPLVHTVSSIHTCGLASNRFKRQN